MMTARDQSSFEIGRPAFDECTVRSSVEHRLKRSGYAVLSRVCCEFQSESGVLRLAARFLRITSSRWRRSSSANLTACFWSRTRSRSPEPQLTRCE